MFYSLLDSVPKSDLSTHDWAHLWSLPAVEISLSLDLINMKDSHNFYVSVSKLWLFLLCCLLQYNSTETFKFCASKSGGVAYTWTFHYLDKYEASPHLQWFQGNPSGEGKNLDKTRSNLHRQHRINLCCFLRKRYPKVTTGTYYNIKTFPVKEYAVTKYLTLTRHSTIESIQINIDRQDTSDVKTETTQHQFPPDGVDYCNNSSRATSASQNL